MDRPLSGLLGVHNQSRIPCLSVQAIALAHTRVSPPLPLRNARLSDEFAVERWEWTLQPGWLGWRRVFACGSKLNMPCDVACYLAIHKLRVGSKVAYGPDETWQCVEEEQWEV